MHAAERHASLDDAHAVDKKRRLAGLVDLAAHPPTQRRMRGELLDRQRWAPDRRFFQADRAAVFDNRATEAFERVESARRRRHGHAVVREIEGRGVGVGGLDVAIQREPARERRKGVCHREARVALLATLLRPEGRDLGQTRLAQNDVRHRREPQEVVPREGHHARILPQFPDHHGALHLVERFLLVRVDHDPRLGRRPGRRSRQGRQRRRPRQGRQNRSPRQVFGARRRRGTRSRTHPARDSGYLRAKTYIVAVAARVNLDRRAQGERKRRDAAGDGDAELIRREERRGAVLERPGDGPGGRPPAYVARADGTHVRDNGSQHLDQRGQLDRARSPVPPSREFAVRLALRKPRRPLHHGPRLVAPVLASEDDQMRVGHAVRPRPRPPVQLPVDIGEIEHEVDRADEIAVKAEINLLLPLRMLRRELGDDARVAHVRDALGAEEARGARELASGDERTRVADLGAGVGLTARARSGPPNRTDVLAPGVEQLGKAALTELLEPLLVERGDRDGPERLSRLLTEEELMETEDPEKRAVPLLRVLGLVDAREDRGVRRGPVLDDRRVYRGRETCDTDDEIVDRDVVNRGPWVRLGPRVATQWHRRLRSILRLASALGIPSTNEGRIGGGA